MNRRLLLVLTLLVLMAGPGTLHGTACPVCYGNPESASTPGMTAAIFSLLGVTGGVLAAFAAVFLRFRKRARALLLSSTLISSSGTTADREAESHG